MGAPDILAIYGVHEIVLHRMRRTPYGPKPDGEGTRITGVFVSETQRLVRDKTGTETVSTAQVAVPHGTPISLDEEPTVTLPSGRTSRVLSISRSDPGPLPLPAHDVWNIE